MQVLVLYYSKGGATKALAGHVAEGVDSVTGVKAVLRSCEQASEKEFLQAAGIIAGSPVYFGTMAWPLKKAFDEFVGIRKRMEGKVGAAFATGGDASGGKETTIFSILQAMLIYGMVIVGDPMNATGHYGVACVGRPDEKTAENGRCLGRRVAQLCRKIFNPTEAQVK